MSAPEDPEELARRLAERWEERARSPHRDLYVASHPGWNDPAAWAAQAELDAGNMLYQVDREALRGFHVLDVGCGVGRLAHPLAQRAATYTGFDIAPGMIGEARRRCADLENARFFVSDGLSVPEAARDRLYDLALCVAVFIHCPPEVSAGLVRSVYGCLAPGGQLRFQFRADPSDPEGLVALEQAEVHAQEATALAVDPEQAELTLDEDYSSHAFRYAELGRFLEGLTPGAATLIRVDALHVYGWIERPR
jgi:SAM-dependent methyltransferase